MDHLFSIGHPWSVNSIDGIDGLLKRHEVGVIKKINSVPDIRDLTDAFLNSLIEESFVNPISIDFEKKSRKTKFRDFYANKYPRRVVTICLPFTGDAELLRRSPSPCSMHFPIGKVVGSTIQFEIVVWDEAKNIGPEIESNIELINSFIKNVNAQVNEFNSTFVEKIRIAFTSKLDKIKEENSVLDDLGFPEVEVSASKEPSPNNIPSLKKRSGQVIIQIMDKMIVDKFNQINHNLGDVSNAVQSNES